MGLWVQEGMLNIYILIMQLKVDTNGATLFMTEAIMNPVKNREKMAEIKFEKFGFGKLQVGIQALLPLFAEVYYNII